jgi:hypothetical protein
MKPSYTAGLESVSVLGELELLRQGEKLMQDAGIMLQKLIQVYWYIGASTAFPHQLFEKIIQA